MLCRTLSRAIFILQISNLLSNPIVQLPKGTIKGREATTIENKSYYAFQGIPYAAPPIGELRFKSPQPVEKWNGVLDTTELHTICLQISNNTVNGSENCLYINVYTPALPSEKNKVSLPVMLYIHGGAFDHGSGVDMAPDLYVNYDVILATINYRLGIFGFISTHDEIIPGNYGLKDQQYAIQWTHDNIHLFGGNSDRITIFGNSAGSASCAYQLLNKNSNGLFQAVILESGSFLTQSAYQRRARQIAFKTASFLNSAFKDSDDSQALLDYLLTVDAEDLIGAAHQYNKDEYGTKVVQAMEGHYWAPVVEVNNPDAFFTKKMYGLLQAGNIIKVPTLIGIVSEESLLFIDDKNMLNTILRTFDENVSCIVPNDMRISDESKRTEMGGLIRDLYTGGELFTDHLSDGVRFISDTAFNRPIIKHAELFSQVSETYFYIFSYHDKMGGTKKHYDGAKSVEHTAELAYLFCSGIDCDSNKFSKSDRITRQRLIRFWTNFAKYRNPTPEPSELLQNVTWPQVSTADGNFYYLDINENLEIKNHPKKNTYNGWNELYNSLGYSDFDTY